MTTGVAPEGAPDEVLALALQKIQEAAALDQRIAAAEDRAQASARAALAASEKLSVEEADVARLESLSWSRILSSLRGARTTDQDRERAEADAARYESGVATARSQADRQEVRQLEAQRAALGDVHATHEAALAAKERWLAERDPAVSGRLQEIAVARGSLGAEDRETREAQDAGSRAHRRLSEAAATLAKARDWATWDTFGGGGLFTDMMKYDRLDQVGRELREAEAALRSFTNELADVHLPATAALDIDSLTHVFDVWFDNIFTDWAVRDRIIDAQRKIDRAVDQVAATVTRLAERRTTIAARHSELVEERRTLLGG